MVRVRRVVAAVGTVMIVGMLAATLSACVPESAPTAEVPSSAPAPQGVGALQTTLVSVIDGDTVETAAGTVRLIGIDSPERGECGYAEASAELEKLLSPGATVVLKLPEGQNDTDRHGRLIRYVETTDGVDAGLVQLDAGHAVARYDSTDGYPRHPREADYHAAQRATLTPEGSVVTVTCASVAFAPPVEPAPPVDRWWEQYTSCTKLKKNTVGHPTGPFARDDPAEAEIYDWFANRTGNNGDGEGDGLACE